MPVSIESFVDTKLRPTLQSPGAGVIEELKNFSEKKETKLKTKKHIFYP
jgi:hypothetical protein